MVAEGFATGGKFIGGVALAWMAFRLFVWGCEFVARLWKEHCARVDAKTLLADRSIADRLKHLEHELNRYREATMMLLNRLAEVLPGDPALIEAARILRATAPSLDDLIAGLSGNGEGNQRGVSQ